MIEGKAIYEILTGDAALTTELGGSFVHAIKAPQLDDFPYIIFHTISGRGHETKDGVSILDELRIQLDIYAEGYIKAATIGNLSRNALEAFSGAFTGGTIDSIRYLTHTDSHEKLYQVNRRSIDFKVRIKDPTT